MTIDKTSPVLYLQGMEKNTSDNKYCDNPDNLLKIPHLDWFEASIWSSFAGVQYFVREIKKTLFHFMGIKLTDKYGNQRYHDSLRSDEPFGVTIFHNVRNNVQNAPISIEFSGRFFRYARHAEFLDFLLRFLNSIHPDVSLWREARSEDVKYRWQPTRVDASVDFVSFSEKPFIPFPMFKQISGSQEREFTSVFRGHSLDKIFHGKDGARLTVYNKLTDDNDAEYLSRHPEFDGCSGVWRLEFQFRRSEIKGLYRKIPFSFGTYNNIFNTILGQCGRRYSFDGFDITPALTSSYIPRKKPDDEATLQYFIDRWLHLGRKVKQFEGVVFPYGDRPSYQKTMIEEEFQKDFDLYSAFDEALRKDNLND